MSSRFGGARKEVRRNVLHVDVPKRGQGKKFWVRGLVLATVLGLLGVVGVGVNFATQRVIDEACYKNPDFQLKTINVKVQGAVTRAEVLQASGLQKGQNLMTLDLDEIRARLKRMSYVESVRVERQLPSTLKISIEERQPAARIRPYFREGNQQAQAVPIYYIDAQGYVMKPKPGEKLRPLPEIMGVEASQIQEGQKTDRNEIINALNLLRLADYSALRSELDLTQIHVQSKGYLLLKTQNQGTIRFRTGYLDQQILRLQYVMEKARELGMVVRTVDLAPERNVPVTFFN